MKRKEIANMIQERDLSVDDNFKVEGPWAFKGADGHESDICIFQKGTGEKVKVGKATITIKKGMHFKIDLDEEYKDIEIGAFEAPMRFTVLRPQKEPVINWGYNCLTYGVHHGRPESLWRLPLLQATIMFEYDELKEIVVARIRNDAMLYVEHGDLSYTKEWANQVTALAEENFDDLLAKKLEELQEYYTEPRWRRDVQGVVERIKLNKLNPHYEPLHGHDTINLLCRILGQGADHTIRRQMQQGE